MGSGISVLQSYRDRRNSQASVTSRTAGQGHYPTVWACGNCIFPSTSQIGLFAENPFRVTAYLARAHLLGKPQQTRLPRKAAPAGKTKTANTAYPEMKAHHASAFILRLVLLAEEAPCRRRTAKHPRSRASRSPRPRSRNAGRLPDRVNSALGRGAKMTEYNP